MHNFGIDIKQAVTRCRNCHEAAGSGFAACFAKPVIDHHALGLVEHRVLPDKFV